MARQSKQKKIINELPLALTSRLEKLIDVRKIRRHGESASAAFARRLHGKTDRQIRQMLYKLESGDRPGRKPLVLRGAPQAGTIAA